VQVLIEISMSSLIIQHGFYICRRFGLRSLDVPKMFLVPGAMNLAGIWGQQMQGLEIRQRICLLVRVSGCHINPML